MNALRDLLLFLGVVATGWHLVNMKPEYRDDYRPHRRRSDGLTARELCGLVDVDYTEDLVLVSPRGVELPYSPAWELEQMLAYLVEVDAL